MVKTASQKKGQVKCKEIVGIENYEAVGDLVLNEQF